MKHQSQQSSLCTGILVLFLATFTGFPSFSLALDLNETPKDPPKSTNGSNNRQEVFLGYHNWDDLAKLSPDAGGSFDSGGYNLGAAFHWKTGRWGNGDVLSGIDFALFTNDSNIPNSFGDLIARGLYITPSVKLVFDGAISPRYALDFGLGYYLVDIADLKIFSGGGYFERELWEASAFGGYVGASVDFPSESSNGRSGFSLSAKIHFFDLGKVSDQGGTNTLGSDAGSLSGPVTMLQLGYFWF